MISVDFWATGWFLFTLKVLFAGSFEWISVLFAVDIVIELGSFQKPLLSFFLFLFCFALKCWVRDKCWFLSDKLRWVIFLLVLVRAIWSLDWPNRPSKTDGKIYQKYGPDIYLKICLQLYLVSQKRTCSLTELLTRLID